MSTIYEEMKEIESAIQETYMLSNIKINSDSLTLYDQIEIPKVDASDYEAQLNGENEYNYYYLDFTSSKDLEKILEMENVDNDYILDFDNLNVYLVEGIEIDGKLIYNSDDFAKYYENIILK